MITTVFLDESGYTGDDLLDPSQPVFAVATHNFADDECDALKEKFFAHVGGKELKHSSLQRRGVHQKAIVSFLAEMVTQPARFRIALAHKRFALTLKVVDLVVEPFAHRYGLDIYRTGFFRSFGNLLFFALQAGGSTILDEILRTFQDVVRRRTEVCLNEFHRVVNRPALLEPLEQVLDMVRIHANLMPLSQFAAHPPQVLDISATMALQCIYAWRSMNAGALSVAHDRSSNMARQRHLWDAIVSPRAPAALVGYGANAVEFPLGVETTSFVNSEISDGIQIADVLAGAMARWGRWMACGRSPDDAYGMALDRVVASADKSFLATFMWPIPDVDRDDTSPELGDFLAYLTNRAADAADSAAVLAKTGDAGQ